MMLFRSVPFALACALAAPVLAQQTTTPLPDATIPAQAQAQYDQGYSGPRSPDATGGNPGTTALNGQALQQSTGARVDDATAQGQYAADMAAYRGALIANHHEAMRDQAHYEHQQRAYASAMAAWRMQVEDCKRSNYACKAPAPDPADYY